MSDLSLRPRVVVFGRRGAGKSEFVAACSRAVHSAEFVDTDSSTDEQALATGTVPEPMEVADALAVTIDIAANDSEIASAVDAVRHYLSRLESNRRYRRDVSDWPIAVILTKCDRLLKLGFSAREWRDAIALKVEPLRQKLITAFDSQPDRFGTVDLTVWPTATRSPALAGAPTDETGGFGMVTVADHLARTARDYGKRTASSNRWMRGTFASALALLGLFIATSIVSELTSKPAVESPLATEIRSYQSRERPAGVRLSEARRPRTKMDLVTIQDSPDWNEVPEDLREFIAGRLAELERYEQYAKPFRRPAPADCRNEKELEQLAVELKSTLSPPAEDAANWSETEAVLLREKWAKDIDLLRAAESRLYDWTRGLSRRANDLYVSPSLNRSWAMDVNAAIRAADTPPFKASDVVPGSSELPVLGGERLSYATAFEFDRVEAARRDWEFNRDRLSRLLAVADALGFTGSDSKTAGLLDWRDAPKDRAAFLSYGTNRLARLREQLPALTGEPSIYSSLNWPDSSREELKNRLSRSVEFAVGLLREEIRRDVLLAGNGHESLVAWQVVSKSFLNEPGLRDWGVLISLSQVLSNEPTENPVDSLLARIAKTNDSISALTLEFTIPNSLRNERFTPEPELAIEVNGTVQSAKRSGEGTPVRNERVYRFTVEPFSVKSGDPFAVRLKGTISGVAHDLVWDHSRSILVSFDAIRHEPNLVEGNGRSEQALGVSIRVVPEAAWPVAPLLLPEMVSRK